MELKKLQSDSIQIFLNALYKIQVQPNTKEFSHHKFFGGTDASRKEATGAVKALLGFISYAKR